MATRFRVAQAKANQPPPVASRFRVAAVDATGTVPATIFRVSAVEGQALVPAALFRISRAHAEASDPAVSTLFFYDGSQIVEGWLTYWDGTENVYADPP